MQNKKIKLLSVKSDNHGVGSFRNVWPAQQIQKDFKDEIDVQLGLLGDYFSMDYLKSFDIIHFHRQLFPTDENLELKIKELKDAGVILVMDIDDYWSPPTTHPMYTAAIKEKVAEKTIKYFQLVDYVTTTTEIFANYIRKINPNIKVIPNSLDMEHKMWQDEDTRKTDKVRITYIGGSSHLSDLEILAPSMNLLHNDKSLKDKYQIVMCGYDVRGSITQIYPDGRQETRKIFPHETVWNKFEEILTGNHNPSVVDEEYKKWLLKYKNEPYPNKDVYEGNYVRRWTLPLTQYGKHYNYCDICLAPLVENTFNEVKCIVGNSLINTDNGLIKIESIVKNKLKNKVLVDGVEKEIVDYFEYKDIDTIKIVTESGYEIEGTPHHKIMVGKEWKELKDFTTGDTVNLTKYELTQQEYQFLSYPLLLTKTITAERINLSDMTMMPRIIINEDWGRLLGYMLGDGTYSSINGIAISCDSRYEDVVKDVVSLMQRIGLNPNIYKKPVDKRCKNSIKKEGFGVDVKAASKSFWKLSKLHGFCGNNGKVFNVADVILKSPKSVIKEFIKGLFEADGTIEECGISFTSKELTLVKQIQILLLSFNIKSRIYYNYNKFYRKYYYRLNICRSGSDIFEKEINFFSERKKQKLKKVTRKSHSNKYTPQVLTDKVKTIEYTKNNVFDIEVKDIHCYVANGILNHNSELKVVESGLKRKVLIAQDFGAYSKFIKHGESGFLVPKYTSERGWYEYIKKLILDKDLRDKISTNLYNFVIDKYTTKIVTADRVAWYKSIYNERNLMEKENSLLLTNNV